MIEIQQGGSIKARINDLKTYIHNLKQSIQNKKNPRIDIKQQPNFNKNKTQTSPVSKIENKRFPNAKIMLENRQKMRVQVQNKTNLLCGIGHNINQKLICSNRPIPTNVHVYRSKFLAADQLQRLVTLLSHEQWQCSGIYLKSISLIIFSSVYLQTYQINPKQIITESVQIYKNYIKFQINNEKNRFCILNFKDVQQAKNWHKFIIQCTNIFKYSQSVQLKWAMTNIMCKNYNQKQKNRFQQKYFQTEQSNNILPSKQSIRQSTSKDNKTSRSLKNKQSQQRRPRKSTKINQKESQQLLKSSIFKLKKVSQISQKMTQQSQSLVFSASTDNNNKSRLIQIQAIRIQQDDLAQSVGFVTDKQKQNFINQNDLISGMKRNSSFQRRDTNQFMQTDSTTTKISSKIQQKNKLLAQSLSQKLSIYWNEDPNQKHQLVLEPNHIQEKSKQIRQSKQIKLIQNNNSNQSTNKIQTSTRRDSSFSPVRQKRIQSATINKTIQKQQDSQMEELKRKKTQFSAKSDSQKKRSKNQIRDHYLQRLIQKQTIKQMSKSSSQAGGSSKKQLAILLPIPQKNTPSGSVYGSFRYEGQVQFSQSNSVTLESKQSTQFQIEIQQLRNGIILQKCSKNVWSTKQKKLYLSNTMAQLCYCDIQNAQQQRRFYLKDIKDIQYGKVSKGIMKHKKRYDQNRCLLIRLHPQKRGRQEKILQFYLQQSQPVSNLQQFSKKLKDFIQRQSLHQQHSQD